MLGSPASHQYYTCGHSSLTESQTILSTDETNAQTPSNNPLFNLNFKEFKRSLPLSATAVIKSSPTVLSSDILELPSALSCSLASSSSSPNPMANSKSPKKATTSNLGGFSSAGGTSLAAGAAAQQLLPPLLPPQAPAAPLLPPTSLLLNKSATTSTGIYQQSVLLRSRLQRLPPFSQFLEFSQSGPRANRDVVQQLWETFALGKPLCVLFNLQERLPLGLRIVEYADEEVDPDPLRKERQRAIALFIMGANQLKNAGWWEKDAPLFSISELVGDAMDTNGFVKVVATVLYLLDKLPPSIWSSAVEGPATGNVLSSHEPISSRADLERMNVVRELIETERKYCQDLEIMQVGSQFEPTPFSLPTSLLGLFSSH